MPTATLPVQPTIVRQTMKTPQPRVIVAIPAYMSNVVNGNFELRSDGSWAESSLNYVTIIENDSRTKPRSGQYYA